MNKFLIINPFGIGDVLFTTAVIRAIKDSQPDSVIGYWCNERVEPILKHNPRLDRIWALSRGDVKKIYQKSKWKGIYRFWNLLYCIKKEKFDVALDFSLDHRYSLISKLLGIKKRIGFNYKKRGRFLTDKIDIDGYNDRHVVEYYLDLLKILDITPKAYNLELFISEGDRIRSKNILADCGIKDKDLIIGIAPGGGASWGKDAHLKHWPAVRFGQLADKIVNAFKAQILILGDESEKGIADIIINTMKNRTIDLTGKTTLEDLTAIINNLHILITNDGGPLHIAVALGKKTVSFFGPVDPKVYGPYPCDGKRHIVLKRVLECSPCYSKFRSSICQRNRECLEKINIDEAIEAVSSLLS